MSGVELLPFVWALPVAYIAASYGQSRDEQEETVDRGFREQVVIVQEALPGNWQLDEETQGAHTMEYRCLDEDEAVEVFLNRRGCICFLP